MKTRENKACGLCGTVCKILEIFMGIIHATSHNNKIDIKTCDMISTRKKTKQPALRLQWKNTIVSIVFMASSAISNVLPAWNFSKYYLTVSSIFNDPSLGELDSITIDRSQNSKNLCKSIYILFIKDDITPTVGVKPTIFYCWFYWTFLIKSTVTYLPSTLHSWMIMQILWVYLSTMYHDVLCVTLVSQLNWLMHHVCLFCKFWESGNMRSIFCHLVTIMSRFCSYYPIPLLMLVCSFFFLGKSVRYENKTYSLVFVV